jgi:putative DNA primase/helicase
MSEKFERLELEDIDWYSILPNLGLGIELSMISNPKKKGPCPIEGEGKTRFQFDNRQGRGTWICHYCGSGDGIALIAAIMKCSYIDALILLKEHQGTVKQDRPKRDAAVAKKPPSDAKNRRQLERNWSVTDAIAEGDPVALYLHRRIPMLDLGWLSGDLRTHTRLYHSDEGTEPPTVAYYPAMVGCVVDVEDNPITLHRTYLSRDGFKAPVSPDQVKKLMPGVRTLNGDCIRLNKPVLQSRVLYVCEGIETGLAMVAATQNRHQVWSCLNAGNLSKVRVEQGRFDRVVILADRDHLNPHHGWRPGEHYAQIAKSRLEQDGFTVAIKVPEREGTDYLDLWVEHCQRNKLVA